MELSFSRVVTYSVDLSEPKDQRRLAKYLGITPRRVEIMAEEDTLIDEYGDEISEWITDNPHLAAVTDEQDIEDLQIEY